MCGIVVSSIAMIGIILALISILINSFFEVYQARKNDSTLKQLYSELNQLDRWLSSDFPIVEEVNDYLRARLESSTNISINEFRNGLREKYGIRCPD